MKHRISKRRQKYGQSVTASQFCQSSNDTFILKERQTKTLLQTCLLQQDFPAHPKRQFTKSELMCPGGKFLFATVPLCSRL